MADITSNMICRYKCDENTGSFYINAVEDAHHLFIVGGGWTTGKVGPYCINNSATSQYSTTATWSGIQGTGAFSTALWFKTSGSGTQAVISWGHYTNAGQAYRIRVESGVLWLRVNSATISGGSSLNDGNWHHVVITQPATATASQVKMYIDGSAVTPTVTSGSQALNRSSQVEIFCGYDYLDGAWYVGQKDDIRLYQRELAAADVTELYELTEPTEFANYRMWNHAVGTTARTLTFSGSFTGTTPSSIEVQLADATNTSNTIQDWTALSSLSTGSGTWTGTMSVNDGPYLKMRVRKKNGGGTVLHTSAWSTNKFGVGVLILVAGQSNAAHMCDWYTNLSPTSNLNTALYDASIATWSAPWSDGAIVLTDKLQQALGCVVGVVNVAKGGTGLYAHALSGYWLDTAGGSPYAGALTALTAVGGDVDMILWHQGEADALDGTSIANYKTSLDTLYGRFRSVLSRTATQLPFGVGSIATLNDGSTDAHVQNIKTAQRQWADDTTGAFYLGSNTDATRVDNYHYDAPSYRHIARRWAQTILYQLGYVATSGAGPFIKSASHKNGVIRVKIDLNGATQIQEPDGTTDGAGLTGWEVSKLDDFAVLETINSTAITGVDELTLTLNDLDTGNGERVYIQYQAGAVPTITKPVYSNILPQGDTLGLPLQYTAAAVEATRQNTAVDFSIFYRPKVV